MSQQKPAAEKLLKTLQRLPANKHCADCSGTGALAPQYVNVNAGTFVCTNCATVQCVPRRLQGGSFYFQIFFFACAEATRAVAR